MAQLLTITKAKQQLLELARRNQELGESFIILKDGEPVSALLPFEEYEAILETLDILEDEPDILRKLKSAEREIAAGRYKVWNKEKKLKHR
ncbi:MAG: type II toxin-antitoxin system Phd/YefM family antitoxin [Deltaproteobacteria bacterium]|nr:type II toxin-antitoxin system Phd/YefM family antitoxin [Deltaproteobacteria bacterium]